MAGTVVGRAFARLLQNRSLWLVFQAAPIATCITGGWPFAWGAGLLLRELGEPAAEWERVRGLLMSRAIRVLRDPRRPLSVYALAIQSCRPAVCGRACAQLFLVHGLAARRLFAELALPLEGQRLDRRVYPFANAT